MGGRGGGGRGRGGGGWLPGMILVAFYGYDLGVPKVLLT